MSIPACSSAEPFVAFNVKKKYDVFLSFRGPDTREGFVKKLYSALDRAGIQTFLDQIYLDKGEHVFSYLCESISASRICIPIFSSNFAQSKWCLKEVLHMIESDVRICPLFYDVLPSDLRDGGKYEEDFRQHRIQQTLSTELIKECQSALQTVSNRCGWSSDQFFGEEGDLIQDVVSGIEKELHFDLNSPDKVLNSPDKVLNSPVKVYLDTPKCFGLEWSVEHVRRLLNVADHQKIGRVGIHGMGGIGKTTLAKLVYKLLYSQFEASCFVLDVGGRCEDANGLVKLQTQMLKDVSKFKGEVDHVDRGKGLLKESLRGKKVLLLLDDLRSPEQLEALAGNYSDFGAGSRLIITSRDQQVLKVANADEVYDVRRLPHRHALQLFYFHAFPKSSCSDDQELETLGNNIVSACDGLPLALQLLGNSLVGERDKNVWVDTVDKLTREPYLQKKLRTCYDTLDSYEKEMFQDVACFFKWSTDKEIAMIFWGELIRSPHASLRHLLQKSLVNLGSGNELRMHSCLQDLGRSIANEMSSEPRKRTRLFEEDDVQHVLWRPWEKASRPCYLSYEPNECKILKAEMFKSLYNLQLLWLTDVVIESHFSEAYFQDLRWLRWRRCLSKSLPLGMNLKSLVILEVTDSQITNIWDDRTGRLQNMPPLKLKVLILSGCTFLEKLPATFTYAQLQILDLRNCHSLRALPNTLGNFSSLVSLNMEGCGVSSLPEDFGELSRLQELNLSWCKHLCKLPPSFGNLTQLKKLQIHHNPRLTELPESFGGLKALLYLNAGYCQLSDDGLPAGISELSSLRIIHLEHNGLRSLPSDFQKLSALWELHLDGCKHLSLLPPLPLSLEMLFARDCLRLDTLCCLSDLKSLSRLDVSKSLHLAELPGLESLQGLTSLKLVGCKSISSRTLESCLGGLKSLESVIIGGPGVSRTQLQSFYDSIKGISFKKQCLLSTPDVTSNWVQAEAEAEAGGRKGEEMKCLDYSENTVNYCAGYIVCCVSFAQNWSRMEASTRRLRYTIEREDNLRPCEVIHPQMEGGDPNILEVRVVRVEGDEDFEWLRRGYKVRVNACSDYENWRACFKFLMYEPVHAGYPRVQENPPHTIIFGV